MESKTQPVTTPIAPEPYYKTKLGTLYHGDSLVALESKRLRRSKGKVQLAFTSPPFPLNKKKKYGNLQGDDYLEWFASYAPALRDHLTESGSIVIEIGNAWVQGLPVMSTIVLQSLLAFLAKGDLHLCQEFVWYNPARLPSPIQWVNVERIRVKDAFTRIWWMSPTPRPKADNRRVLQAYSPSMQKLLETGKYNAGRRPSEYKIGAKSFATNNIGAIPPNVLDAEAAPSLGTLLKGTNTRANDDYQNACRAAGMPQHPARMPKELAEFFIRFLTDPGDLVLDPFAGSNTTGYVAESLARKWIGIEADADYAASSINRFPANSITSISPHLKPIR